MNAEHHAKDGARDTSELTPETIVEFLETLFEREGGGEYLGENVTMAEHMLQAAGNARHRGADDEVVVAALVHDVGHFTGALGPFSMTDTFDRRHEVAGAEALARFFPPRVVACVREHVAAKRYLCATDPDYLARLSPASVHSLNLQGGPMSPDEADRFAAHPHLDAILTVRRCDDDAKVAGAPTPSFADFAPRLQRIVDAHAENR